MPLQVCTVERGCAGKPFVNVSRIFHDLVASIVTRDTSAG